MGLWVMVRLPPRTSRYLEIWPGYRLVETASAAPNVALPSSASQSSSPTTKMVINGGRLSAEWLWRHGGQLPHQAISTEKRAPSCPPHAPSQPNSAHTMRRAPPGARRKRREVC